MKKPIVRSMVVGIVLFGSASIASAAMVSITNPGFESDIFADGGFAFGTAAGWVVGSDSGTFNPGSTSMPGGNPPEGNNMAFSNGGGGLSQTLSTTLSANTLYTLSVDIIDRLDTDITSYTVKLLAGNTVIAQDFNSLTPANGSFIVSSTNYTALPGDSLLGSQLKIKLFSGGIQVGFDDVKLEATAVSAVPVPAAVYLFASGIVGVFGFAKRKKA